MGLYRAHFMSHAGDIVGIDHFQAEGDEAAIETGRKLLSSPWGKGREIWHTDRLVHTETYK
jgi:hypothetical protein